MRPILIASLLTLTASSAFAQDAAVARGQKVYADAKCAVCHSVAGVGNKKGALDMVGARLTAADIGLWLTSAPAMAAKAKKDRKPAMKAYTLAPADHDALVAYLQSLK
jgi:mono/diheme cytochrome c family protein